MATEYIVRLAIRVDEDDGFVGIYDGYGTSDTPPAVPALAAVEEEAVTTIR